MSDKDLVLNDETVAAEVRSCLVLKKLSQAELARKMQVTDMYVCRRLKGEVSFGAVELATVAEILDVPVAQFLRGAA